LCLPAEFFGSAVQTGLVASGDDQIATFIREGVGDRETDVLRSAGNERKFSVKRQATILISSVRN
jgi:hypothetical protein